MIDTLSRELASARALKVPASMNVIPGDYAMATLHRPSNVDAEERLGAVVGLGGERMSRPLLMSLRVVVLLVMQRSDCVQYRRAV